LHAESVKPSKTIGNPNSRVSRLVSNVARGHTMLVIGDRDRETAAVGLRPHGQGRKVRN
jgi:hypothetical protein